MQTRLGSMGFVVMGFVASSAVACVGTETKMEPPPAATAPVAPSAATQPTPTQPTPTPPAPPVAPVVPAAELGAPAPDFTLTAADGKSYALADFKGKTVVLEWFNPDCPFVKHAHGKGPLLDQAKRVAGADLVWLSINSSAPGKQGHGVERNLAAATEYAMTNPILLDETGRVGRAYGAIKTPHLFVVNAQGVLVYRGGVDNAPIGVVDSERPRLPDMAADQLINYIDTALEDIRAQRALRLPDMPPYGCSVKYAS